MSMTIDQMIEVLTAAKDGKEIEFRYRDIPDDTWKPAPGLSWNFAVYDYRAAPPLVKLWVVASNSDPYPIAIHQSLEDAQKWLEDHSYAKKDCRIVSVVEVRGN